MPECLPKVDGVVERLEAGIDVADIGCGHGHSTILMAQAFPRPHVFGFDAHPGSIEAAKRNLAEAGVEERVNFEVPPAASTPAGTTA